MLVCDYARLGLERWRRGKFRPLISEGIEDVDLTVSNHRFANTIDVFGDVNVIVVPRDTVSGKPSGKNSHTLVDGNISESSLDHGNTFLNFFHFLGFICFLIYLRAFLVTFLGIFKDIPQPITRATSAI